MEDFAKFIYENMLVVSAVLYLIGMMLKNTPRVADWSIPYILGAIGIVFGVVIIGGVDGVIQGILTAGSAVYANQLIRQLKNREN